MSEKFRRNLLVCVLFVAVTLTWGTTWMAMKITVATVPPIFATGLRFLCASPLLIALARYQKAPLLFPPGQRLFQLAVMLCYFAIPFTLMIYGERFTTASLAAIIFATMPAAVLAASMIFLGEKTSLQQLTGLVISTGTLCVILWHETRSSGETLLQGVVALVVAVLMHATMYVQCKKRCAGISVLSYNALPCLGAGVLLTLTGLSESPDFSQFAPQAILAICYLGVIAGVGGILSYFALQQFARPFQASMVFLVFPLVAISIENQLRGASISQDSLLLMVPFLSGILLTLYRGPARLGQIVKALNSLRQQNSVLPK
ncbi:EamA family transporter [Erwinia sp. OLTSP20]|uniref:DMT family transporter n=1 Tax=unclassified Erwinia TaxID=2622719 RepID=UPI000C1A6FDB|nr:MULTISPECIES: DMT family transporter [unclassified Erwinia]PIJ52218.1 EamA family transporter [Erwinia sp. OAMSP11]PIJ75739.1 multidrug DMT transporter permease [Erwinia sp. OLSSP12]PIJ81146.1 multidrug DMT transporter permease [Erwinia sp. OLMTSP26]PIJ84225.1 multidrug DMT transporter permease [Erwinia sp. OLCASP19]PIJ88690.1 multidrug DMT transporter permease [Erwinia sp. OLMDSP33]